MAVGGGAAVPGDMFDHRHDPARQEPFGDRTRQRGDLLRVLPIGAVADDGVGARDRDVGQRQTIDVDAERREVVCY